MCKLTYFGICLITTFAFISAQTNKLNIAVQDLSAKGLEQSTADIISDRLRSECLNAGVFRVMERSEMVSILKEQGFQKSGACDESSCFVEIGQLLGVERIVAGSVGKIGSLYTISLRMINVSTGEIMFTVNEDFDGNIKGVLTTATANAARKLAAGVGGEIAKAALLGKTGDLYITSSPVGASVEVDGKLVAGETPLTLQKIAAGERHIVVHKGEYYGAKTINIAPDDLVKVDLELEMGIGVLKVFSSPDGAIVVVDDVKRGSTPCKIDELSAGEHNVIVQKENFLSQTSTVSIGVNQTANLSLTLKPAGYITVKTDCSAARIVLNGKEAGIGAIHRYQVEAGIVNVGVEASGFEAFSEQVSLSPGDSSTVLVELVSVFGNLQITSIPAGAKVLLNENQVGVTPYSNLRLQPGNYMLKVQHDNYNPIMENIAIVKNSVVHKEFTLKHTQAFLDSVKVMNAAAKKRNQWVRRIVGGSLAAVSFGGGFYLNGKIQERYERQELLQKEYDALRAQGDNNLFQAYEDSYTNEVQKNKNDAQKRNILYGISGVCTAVLIISIPF